MIVINFWNVKGGVGKSSLSLLLARHLASGGKRILLLDLDGQRSITRVFERENTVTLFDFLFDQCALSEVWFEGEPGLYVAPGSLKILKIQNSIPERKFRDAFADLRDKNAFDFVIIDNAPTLSGLIAASVCASDILVVPSQISFFDFQEVVFSIDEAKRVNPTIRPAVLLNRVQRKNEPTKDEREYLDMFSNELEGHLLFSRIPNTIAVRRSIDRGSDPGKALSAILRELAEELFELMELRSGCAGTPSKTGEDPVARRRCVDTPSGIAMQFPGGGAP
jgi:cellulose biosynthesis protein BcsQ